MGLVILLQREVNSKGCGVLELNPIQLKAMRLSGETWPIIWCQTADTFGTRFYAKYRLTGNQHRAISSPIFIASKIDSSWWKFWPENNPEQRWNAASWRKPWTRILCFTSHFQSENRKMIDSNGCNIALIQCNDIGPFSLSPDTPENLENPSIGAARTGQQYQYLARNLQRVFISSWAIHHSFRRGCNRRLKCYESNQHIIDNQFKLFITEMGWSRLGNKYALSPSRMIETISINNVLS